MNDPTTIAKAQEEAKRILNNFFGEEHPPNGEVLIISGGTANSTVVMT